MPHWGYSKPDEWCKRYPVGKNQSPINILVSNYDQIVQSTCCNSISQHKHHHHHHGQHIITERMASLCLTNGKPETLRPQKVWPDQQRRTHLDSVGCDDHHLRSSSTCSSVSAMSGASGSSCPPSPAAQNYEDSDSSDSAFPTATATGVDQGDNQKLVQRTRFCTSNHKIFLGYPRYLSSMQLCNTGHSWQVSLPEELTSHTLLTGPPLGGREYKLAQLHCHWGEDLEHGSEHLINGNGFAAEIHFVHWNCTDFNSMEEASRHKNGLAVLGVLVEALVGEQHRNKHLDKIANALERIEKPGSKCDVNARLDLKKLFPSNRWNYATYEGSLTTPPLSEVVDWIVFLNPIQCSASQIEQFRRLKCPSEDSSKQEEEQELIKNFRPVQPHNGRLVTIWTHHWLTNILMITIHTHTQNNKE